MTVESAKYIADLNPAYPGASDPVVEGDDHIRLIKKTIEETLVNGSAPVFMVHMATAGTGNEYTVAPTPPITALPKGSVVRFTANRDNTGPSTLKVNNLAPLPIMQGDKELQEGMIVATQSYTAVYDGVAFQLEETRVLDILPVVTLRSVTKVNAGGTAGQTRNVNLLDASSSNIVEVTIVPGTTVNLKVPNIPKPGRYAIIIKYSTTAGNPATIRLPTNMVVANTSYRLGEVLGKIDLVEIVSDGVKMYAKVYEAFQ